MPDLELAAFLTGSSLNGFRDTDKKPASLPPVRRLRATLGSGAASALVRYAALRFALFRACALVAPFRAGDRAPQNEKRMKRIAGRAKSRAAHFLFVNCLSFVLLRPVSSPCSTLPPRQPSTDLHFASTSLAKARGTHVLRTSPLRQTPLFAKSREQRRGLRPTKDTLRIDLFTGYRLRPAKSLIFFMTCRTL